MLGLIWSFQSKVSFHHFHYIPLSAIYFLLKGWVMETKIVSSLLNRSGHWRVTQRKGTTRHKVAFYQLFGPAHLACLLSSFSRGHILINAGSENQNLPCVQIDINISAWISRLIGNVWSIYDHAAFMAYWAVKELPATIYKYSTTCNILELRRKKGTWTAKIWGVFKQSMLGTRNYLSSVGIFLYTALASSTNMAYLVYQYYTSSATDKQICAKKDLIMTTILRLVMLYGNRRRQT